MKKIIRIFYLKILNFLVVKFSVYLNRLVSVMNMGILTKATITVNCPPGAWNMFRMTRINITVQYNNENRKKRNYNRNTQCKGQLYKYC